MDFNQWRQTAKIVNPTEGNPSLRIEYACGNCVTIQGDADGSLTYDVHIGGESLPWATREAAEKALWDLRVKHEYSEANYQVSAMWTITGFTMDDEGDLSDVEFTASASQIMTTKELCEFAEERDTMRHFADVEGFPEDFDSVEDIRVKNISVEMIPAALEGKQKWAAGRQGPRKFQLGNSRVYGYQYPDGAVIEVLDDGGYFCVIGNQDIVLDSLDRVEQWLWANWSCDNYEG